MKYRRLRIAWSAGCLLVCGLLVSLWVRSYEFIDNAALYLGRYQYEFRSNPGHIRFHYVARAYSRSGYFFRAGMPVEEDEYLPLTFYWTGNLRIFSVHFAHWLAAIFVLIFAALPWLRWRFSLRTLLIVMTLVALALGLSYMR